MTPNFVNDMNITLKEVNTFNRELSISLEWSEIEKDFDKSAARFSKKVKIPIKQKYFILENEIHKN